MLLYGSKYSFTLSSRDKEILIVSVLFAPLVFMSFIRDFKSLPAVNKLFPKYYGGYGGKNLPRCSGYRRVGNVICRGNWSSWTLGTSDDELRFLLG